MSGARFVALEKEDLDFLKRKSASGKNANIFMMHFHFLALKGKVVSVTFCSYTLFDKSSYCALNASFYVYKGMTE